MSDFIIKYRRAIITVSVAWRSEWDFSSPLETDPDIRNYIPRNMESRVTNDSIEQEFGVQDMIMVLFTEQPS
jgi:predicted RND superfamily exporter protein